MYVAPPSCCRDGGGRRTDLLYGLATIKHCTDSIDHTMLDEILSQNVEYIAGRNIITKC